MPGTNAAAPAPGLLAIDARAIAFRYGDREALRGVSLTVGVGEIFALVGPNGGGKSTLFRLLSTLARLQEGEATILGHDLRTEPLGIRRQIGVGFQSPSLDKKLSVAENLRCHGRLYGLSGSNLTARIEEMLGRLGLADRKDDLVETLSGGLKRRAELAKTLLHRPSLLLLDEPSTALDPAARAEVWSYLAEIRQRDGVTIALTTHLLDEAEKADRIAMLSEGRIVAEGTPEQLQATVGGDSITIETQDPMALAQQITARFGVAAQALGDAVRLEQKSGHEWIARLVETFPSQITAIRVGKPTLEDVFIARCGRRLNEDLQHLGRQAPSGN